MFDGYDKIIIDSHKIDSGWLFVQNCCFVSCERGLLHFTTRQATVDSRSVGPLSSEDGNVLTIDSAQGRKHLFS